VLKDGEPVAFAVVYPPGIAASRGDPGTGYIRERYGDVPVIKQIATARGHERHGYSTLLYRDFAERHPDLPLFAAIAEEPRNYGSERFHAKLGFAPRARFTAHPDGRPRGIWRRPPAAQFAP
jgi:predicted GNAT superfamily acetyltransferase